LKKKLGQKIRMIDNFIYLVLLMGLSEMRFKVIGLTLEPELRRKPAFSHQNVESFCYSFHIFSEFGNFYKLVS